MSDTPKHLVRPSDLDPAEAVRIRHPFNPNSDVTLQRLAERTGMGRVIVTLARVPPGKESFVLHAHLLHEKFIYVLEGQGTAVIGEAEVVVGPGDFMGFPIDGTAHTLRNTGSTDLVYLMGGERGPVDVAHFPSVGKTVVYSMSEGIRAFDDANARQLTFAEFVAKD
ncbi:MAG: cupin domain-containing protein [Geminicoccaceae bacterium]